MKTANDFSPVPSPQAVVSEQSRRHITIGLPAVAAAGERRFPLTPEGAGMLVEKGFTVKIEAGAGAPIHYPDNAYAREGARICDRSGVLGCDIVISLAPLSVGDIRKMRRGAMLLSMLAQCRFAKDSVMALLERSIMAIAIDLIEDQYGNTPFADILSEIDGRAAVAIASAPPRSRVASLRRYMSLSNIFTLAPTPTAPLAAAQALIPLPTITVSHGTTPATPPSRMPLP